MPAIFGHTFGHILDADWGHQGPLAATPAEHCPCSGLVRHISATLQDVWDPFTSALLCRLSYPGLWLLPELLCVPDGSASPSDTFLDTKGGPHRGVCGPLGRPGGRGDDVSRLFFLGGPN
jgi:hypothetical protein